MHRSCQLPCRTLFPITFLLLLLCGCDNPNESCRSKFPAAVNGPGGESIELLGIMDNQTIECEPGGTTCDFTVAFMTRNVKRTAKAQLMIEIANDIYGNLVYEPNFGPYDQPWICAVDTGMTTDTLRGRLGPPVSALVKFNIQAKVTDSSGVNILCRSQRVVCLRPDL